MKWVELEKGGDSVSRTIVEGGGQGEAMKYQDIEEMERNPTQE